MLAYGCLSPDHAGQFKAFVKHAAARYALDAVLRGETGWPTAPGDRDLLHFLAMSLRARLRKELPADKRGGSEAAGQLAYRSKALIVELADLSLEIAQLVLAGDEDGNPMLPAWYLTEVMRDLPRLVAARA